VTKRTVHSDESHAGAWNRPDIENEPCLDHVAIGFLQCRRNRFCWRGSWRAARAEPQEFKLRPPLFAECRWHPTDASDSLQMIMKTRATWARMVVAIFTMAMFYASVCSASCAVGVCPDKVQQTTSHDCDQMPAHHSDQSRHGSPDNPDCSQHQHPGVLVAKTGNFSQFQLTALHSLHVSAAASSPLVGLPAIFSQSAASEHAPPIVSGVPVYEQISVLRI
jgi:hypothetical protein